MSVTTIHEQFERAEAAFRAERDYVERQRQILQQLERDGHATDVAARTLGIMQRALAAFEHHRRILLERIGVYRP